MALTWRERNTEKAEREGESKGKQGQEPPQQQQREHKAGGEAGQGGKDDKAADGKAAATSTSRRALVTATQDHAGAVADEDDDEEDGQGLPGRKPHELLQVRQQHTLLTRHAVPPRPSTLPCRRIGGLAVASPCSRYRSCAGCDMVRVYRCWR